MSLGRAIAEFRKKKHMNQADLARELGVHHSYVTRWENDRVRPRVKSLEKLAEILEVTTQDLLMGGRDGVAETLNIDDVELVELLRQIPRLDQRQQEALKTVLQDMLTRSQFHELLQR